MMKIIITGCAGFIGYKLSKELIKKYKVIGIDNFYSGDLKKVKELKKSKNFCFFNESIENFSFFESFFKKNNDIYAIIHLAGITDVDFSKRNENLTMNINYIASKKIFMKSKKYKIPRFIFAGSAAEYGNYNKEKNDDIDARCKLLSKISPYAFSKFKVSEYIKKQNYGCSLRLFNVYGPGQNPNNKYSGVITKFIYKLINKKKITIYGDGKQTRDFVYIDDVVQAFVKSLKDFDEKLIGTFNIGTNKKTSINKLIEIISKINKSKPKITHKKIRDHDIIDSVSNGKNFYTITGFSPKINIKKGLIQTFKGFKGLK